MDLCLHVTLREGLRAYPEGERRIESDFHKEVVGDDDYAVGQAWSRRENGDQNSGGEQHGFRIEEIHQKPLPECAPGRLDHGLGGDAGTPPHPVRDVQKISSPCGLGADVQEGEQLEDHAETEERHHCPDCGHQTESSANRDSGSASCTQGGLGRHQHRRPGARNSDYQDNVECYELSPGHVLPAWLATIEL